MPKLKFGGLKGVYTSVCLVIALWPNDYNQSHGFIVDRLKLIYCQPFQLQYSTRSAVERSGSEEFNKVLSQALDSQKIGSIVPSTKENFIAAIESVGNLKTAGQMDPPIQPKVKVISSKEPRPFPFSMIIDLKEIKHALLLSAVNPYSIGVLISGGRGTATSVLARSTQKIIPQYIRRIEGMVS